MREELNRTPGVPLEHVADEADHFIRCSHCRQAFDLRNLGDVLHHSLLDHEPIGKPQ